MREFIVNSSEGIKDLLKSLKGIKNITVNSDYSSLTCRVSNEKEYALFRAVISKYLIKKYFIKSATQIMKRKRYSKESIENYTWAETIKTINESDYYILNTEILIDEYFKNLNVINLEAFMSFNMAGFKEEVDIIINYAENMSDEEYYSYDEDEEEDGEDSEYVQGEIIDISQYINVDDFSEISIVATNNELVIRNKKGEEFSKGDMIKKLEVIPFDLLEKLMTDNYIQKVKFLGILIAVLRCKKVRIINKDTKFAQDLGTYLNMIGLQVQIEVI